MQSQIRSIQQEKISGDNIYRLLLAFDEVYHSATEAEQKEFMKAFIERIDDVPRRKEKRKLIKKIVFNFPVPVDGEEVKELPLETETTVETVVLLEKTGDGRKTRIAVNEVESMKKTKLPVAWLIFLAAVCALAATVLQSAGRRSRDFSMAGKNVSRLDTEQILTHIRKARELQGRIRPFM